MENIKCLCEAEEIRFYDATGQASGEKALVGMSSNFEGLKGVTSLADLFYKATNIAMELDENLFKNLSEVTSTFRGLPGLTGSIESICE